MDKQAREARDKMRNLKGKEKWSNYWYYYRFYLLAVLFVIVVLIFTVSDCTNKPKPDLEIYAYTSSVSLSPEQVKAFSDYVEAQIDDINENEVVEAYVSANVITVGSASESNQAVVMKLNGELAAGDAMAYIFDDEILEFLGEVKDECFDTIIPISDIPLIKQIFGLKDGEKLYWATKALYESEKNKEDKILKHNNALKVQKYLQSL